MNNYRDMIDEIYTQLYNIVDKDGDLTDLGNEIGNAVGRIIKQKDSDDFTEDDFIAGVKHGISIQNGTH